MYSALCFLLMNVDSGSKELKVEKRTRYSHKALIAMSREGSSSSRYGPLFIHGLLSSESPTGVFSCRLRHGAEQLWTWLLEVSWLLPLNAKLV